MTAPVTHGSWVTLSDPFPALRHGVVCPGALWAVMLLPAAGGKEFHTCILCMCKRATQNETKGSVDVKGSTEVLDVSRWVFFEGLSSAVLNSYDVDDDVSCHHHHHHHHHRHRHRH